MWEVEALYYAHAGLSGAALVTLVVIWIASLRAMHRCADPARVAFTILKVALPAFIITLTLNIAEDIENVTMPYYGGWVGPSDKDPAAAANRLLKFNISTCASLFEFIASSLLVVMLVELGNGLMLATIRQRSKSQNIMRYLGIFFATVLFALGLADFGVRQATWPRVWNAPDFDDNEATNDYYDSVLIILMRLQKLDLAWLIINWVTSAGILGYASFVMHRYRSVKPSRTCTIMFLVAAILGFIKGSWAAIQFLIFSYWPWYYFSFRVTQLTSIFLISWMLSGVMVLVFAIGVKKQGGLWTVSRPWMNESTKSADVEDK
ncbi:hypothetical protein BKA56DRAFT_623106 [Ilyonectria sp. MPI-CAGE-AT-0026]|nr:hypothetical protein BKA56DRAFT_623106 [Ilyonectria sp. MPI-CAGE-AT-0026]